MIEEVPVERIEKAVDEYVDKMTVGELLEYVYSNMTNYYIEVADLDEAEEFLQTGRDTSVYVEAWA
tara:strand:- start:308 stop:505 length:198 start_codon:yes stop_codon:yes gene_type:complete